MKQALIFIKEVVPGLTVTLMISIMAVLVSSLHPSFDSLVIAIIFGMLASGMLADEETFKKGVDASIRFFLPLGIGLYGLQLTFRAGDAGMWPLVAGVVAFFFVVAYFISRGFGLDRGVSALLGAGMAICGASAIAILAPILGSEREDTSISLISVLTVGLTGMLLYQFLPDLGGLTESKFAFFSGATLPMLGQVKIAASGLSREGMELALNFKLMRVAFLALAALVAVVAEGRRRRKFFVPWFMVMFFVLALAGNLWDFAASLRPASEYLGGFLLTAALAAIGLSIDMDSIADKGARPLLAVFLTWGIVVLVLYFILNFKAFFTGP